MPVIIDMPFSIVETVQLPLQKKIRQIVCEPPTALLFVKVRIVDQLLIEEDVHGEAYRVTLCGVGGVPLPGEKEFVLYQVICDGRFNLRYVAKR